MTTKTKADANGPFKEFEFEVWLRDGMKEFCSKLGCDIKGLDLSDFRQHLRNAQKERLLAMRSAIDKAIERLDEAEAPRQA